MLEDNCETVTFTLLPVYSYTGDNCETVTFTLLPVYSYTGDTCDTVQKRCCLYLFMFVDIYEINIHYCPVFSLSTPNVTTWDVVSVVFPILQFIIYVTIIAQQSISSVDRQKGLTSSHMHIQLDHFASKQTTYMPGWQLAAGVGSAGDSVCMQCVSVRVILSRY